MAQLKLPAYSSFKLSALGQRPAHVQCAMRNMLGTSTKLSANTSCTYANAQAQAQAQAMTRNLC